MTALSIQLAGFELVQDFVWFLLGWALVLTIGIWGLLCLVGVLAYLLYRLYCWALED